MPAAWPLNRARADILVFETNAFEWDLDRLFPLAGFSLWHSAAPTVYNRQGAFVPAADTRPDAAPHEKKSD